MTREYLKQATFTARSDAPETKEIVREILDDIEAGGEEVGIAYAKKFDKYDGAILLSPEARKGARPVAEATARIARLEGMEAQARTADIRLKKYFPDEAFDLTAEG